MSPSHTHPMRNCPWTCFPRTSRIQSLPSPWSQPPSPCRIMAGASLCRTSCLSEYILNSGVICLKVSHFTDISAQNPALALKIKYHTLTHVAAPGPPKPWPPLPLYLLSRLFPLTPLQPHCCSTPAPTAVLLPLPGIFFPVLRTTLLFS